MILIDQIDQRNYHHIGSYSVHLLDTTSLLSSQADDIHATLEETIPNSVELLTGHTSLNPENP